MARIAGVDLPRDKRVEIGLTYIYGIGRKTADDIIAATGVNPDTRVRDLTEEDIAKLREYIEHHCRVEGDLRRDLLANRRRNSRNNRVMCGRMLFRACRGKRSNHAVQYRTVILGCQGYIHACFCQLGLCLSLIHI